MLKAAIAWIVTFGLSALLARGAAWQVAFQMTIGFPSYDDEAIYSRVKARVFTRAWMICAIVGSTATAGAMLADEPLALALIVFGAILIVTQVSFQGYKLFLSALSEMGLPWPPPSGS
jgi:hypothetical protein